MSLPTLWNACGSSDWCPQCKAFDFVSLGWKSLGINTQYAESSVAFRRTNQASAAKNCPVNGRNGLAKADTILKGFYPKLPLLISSLSHPQTGVAEPKELPTDSVMVPSLFNSSCWELLQQNRDLNPLNRDLNQFGALRIKYFHKAGMQGAFQIP